MSTSFSLLIANWVDRGLVCGSIVDSNLSFPSRPASKQSTYTTAADDDDDLTTELAIQIFLPLVSFSSV